MTVILPLAAVLMAAAAVVLLARLASGMRRPPALAPVVEPLTHTSVSVVVPARNEAGRIGPCLAGLRVQDAPLIEVLVVDGGTTLVGPSR